jgi:hypothetical protein
MSGNPTNSDYFPDTCVYINYGVIGESFHEDAVQFFSKSYSKHTSNAVLVEIEDFKTFISRFGRDINKAVGTREWLNAFKNPYIVFRDYNENQMSFIMAFLKTVVGRPPLQVSQKYALLKSIVNDRIAEALAKTTKPYINQSTDTKFLSLISFVEDEGDKQIIADAALWSTSFKYRNFCTADEKHILRKKVDLETTITKHYGRNCLIFAHLENA